MSRRPKALGYGKSSVTYVETIDGVEYAIKTFYDYRVLSAEVSAYEKLQDAEPVTAYIPRYYGPINDCHYSGNAIRLELLQGRSLCSVLPTLSADARDKLHSTLAVVLQKIHEAGVYHGDVHDENILVAPGNEHAWFIDFSDAGLYRLLMRGRWDLMRRRDRDQLAKIFKDAASEEAMHTALELTDAPFEDDAALDRQLHDTLRKITNPIDGLVDAIKDRIDEPSPDLTLELACKLDALSRQEEAVRLLLDCIDRYEKQQQQPLESKGKSRLGASSSTSAHTPSGGRADADGVQIALEDDKLAHMKCAAAGYQARAEIQGFFTAALPSADELYARAVDDLIVRCGAAEHSYDVQLLRRDWGKFLRITCNHVRAMAVYQTIVHGYRIGFTEGSVEHVGASCAILKELEDEFQLVMKRLEAINLRHTREQEAAKAAH